MNAVQKFELYKMIVIGTAIMIILGLFGLCMYKVLLHYDSNETITYVALVFDILFIIIGWLPMAYIILEFHHSMKTYIVNDDVVSNR